MDTTPEYILRCKKAVELQRIAPRSKNTVKWSDGITEPSFAYQEHDVFYEEVSCDTGRLIWIPRQGWYQEKLIKLLCCTVGHLLDDFYLFCDTHVPQGNEVSAAVLEDSFEKLWQRFYMHKCFNKSWDGKNWNGRTITT